MDSENIDATNNTAAPVLPVKPTVSIKPKMPVQPIPNTKNLNGIPTNNTSNNGTHNGLRILRPETYVGFDTLPDQYVSRVIRDGFGFNILAIGSTGVGKTTLFEALFNTKLSPETSTRSHNSSGVSVSTQQIELNEGSIKLKLTLIESKGFGDQIDKSMFIRLF